MTELTTYDIMYDEIPGPEIERDGKTGKVYNGYFLVKKNGDVIVDVNNDDPKDDEITAAPIKPRWSFTRD